MTLYSKISFFILRLNSILGSNVHLGVNSNFAVAVVLQIGGGQCEQKMIKYKQ